MLQLTAGQHPSHPSYAVAFQRVHFALLPTISISNLAHFPAKPGQRGKTKVRIDVSCLG